jgi:hypothetical protein
MLAGRWGVAAVVHLLGMTQREVPGMQAREHVEL